MRTLLHQLDLSKTFPSATKQYLILKFHHHKIYSHVLVYVSERSYTSAWGCLLISLNLTLFALFWRNTTYIKVLRLDRTQKRCLKRSIIFKKLYSCKNRKIYKYKLFINFSIIQITLLNKNSNKYTLNLTNFYFVSYIYQIIVDGERWNSKMLKGTVKLFVFWMQSWIFLGF